MKTALIKNLNDNSVSIHRLSQLSPTHDSLSISEQVIADLFNHLRVIYKHSNDPLIRKYINDITCCSDIEYNHYDVDSTYFNKLNNRFL